MPPPSNCRTASTSGTSPRNDASPLFPLLRGEGFGVLVRPSPFAFFDNCRATLARYSCPLPAIGQRKPRRQISNMPEPVSQIVAQMPRGKRVGLLLLFLGPAVAVYTLFSIYPLIATMALWTYTSDPSGARHFVGLANFEALLGDALWSKPFWNAFSNNLIFFAVHMCVQNPIGIALAGLLSLPGLKLKGLYRTVMFLPTMLSVVIVGFSWNLILSPLWGVAAGALKAVGLGSLFAPWLGLESSALITLSLISVWQFVGIPMMLIYAALL